jgi:transcriptional regulator GlxA family with amidase domain
MREILDPMPRLAIDLIESDLLGVECGGVQRNRSRDERQAKEALPVRARGHGQTAPQFGLDAVALCRAARYARGRAFPAPCIEEEIWYKLLKGSAGDALSQLAFEGSTLARIGRVTSLLRERYAAPVNLAELASRAGMSRTTFHETFQRMAGTTPPKFQKVTRLQEARRLLGVAQRNMFQVAFDVGYVSPSHFNRDYRRMFGITPAADARRMKIDPQP